MAGLLGQIWPYGHIWAMSLSKYGNVVILGQKYHQHFHPFLVWGCRVGNSLAATDWANVGDARNVIGQIWPCGLITVGQ